MKILLVQPALSPSTIGEDEINIFEPLALEYIAAGVSNKHDVRLLDLRLENNLQGTLRDFSPDVVGITAYTVHVNTVKRLFQEIKESNTNILTVVGGHHATVAPQDFIHPSIDLIVLGEGVFVFKEIIARHEKGKGFDGIPGTAFAIGGNLISTNNNNDPVDLDTFPFPDRSIKAKYIKKYGASWMKPVTLIRTSKGCPYRCKFCASWKFTGGRYLTRKPETVVEELTSIKEKYIFFADDESLVDAARMKTLAEMIKDARIHKRYILFGRSDTITRNAELIKIWRDIGLERVFVGLEFFRDADLEYIGQGTTISDNYKAVQLLRRLGIQIVASFIVRPEFAIADFAALRQYCRKLDLYHAIFYVMTPLPGTDLYSDVENLLITHNYDYFDSKHTVLPTTLPLKDFYEEYSKLLRQAIPRRKSMNHWIRLQSKEIPRLFLRFHRTTNRLRKAYMDHEEE